MWKCLIFHSQRREKSQRALCKCYQSFVPLDTDNNGISKLPKERISSLPLLVLSVRAPPSVPAPCSCLGNLNNYQSLKLLPQWWWQIVSNHTWFQIYFQWFSNTLDPASLEKTPYPYRLFLSCSLLAVWYQHKSRRLLVRTRKLTLVFFLNSDLFSTATIMLFELHLLSVFLLSTWPCLSPLSQHLNRPSSPFTSTISIGSKVNRLPSTAVCGQNNTTKMHIIFYPCSKAFSGSPGLPGLSPNASEAF